MREKREVKGQPARACIDALTSSSFSSSSRLIDSPSQYTSVSGATMQYSAGSVSTTLNSTVRMPPRTRKVSPCRCGCWGRGGRVWGGGMWEGGEGDVRESGVFLP
jgi:hypothetical protein